MNRIVTFGEVMLRFNPAGYLRLVQADKFEVNLAGGEANVAVSLANYGADAAFVTKVPSHEIGDYVIREMRRNGVDTSLIVRGGKRLGTFYLEKGASQRPSKVIYDRENSAIAMAQPKEFDWNEIFKGAKWFHFTGITPALSENMAKACLDACVAAKKMGITISCDLNYRSKLWSKEDAGCVMAELMKYVDVCIANEQDAADVFGIHAAHTDIDSGNLSYEGYIDVASQLTKRFDFKKVAITLRGSLSASRNIWAGMLYDAKTQKAEFSREYDIQIVDRVGGGDSFGGALIYALTSDYEDKKAIEFAVAASCLKHTIEHDFNMVSLKEVETLAAGNGSGRVVR
ncbi:MAG: sugar kinase [Ruminococcaceae bacterium]|nr:sugar kinase [Oscillospiraceae bacterium]